MKEVIKYIKDFEILPFIGDTIFNNFKQILIIGILPSFLAFWLFSNDLFFEFTKHHLEFLNYWPHLFISVIIYIIGFTKLFFFGKTHIESEFKALFQNAIGVCVFLFLLCVVSAFRYMLSDIQESFYFVFPAVLFGTECFGLIIFLGFMDKFEKLILNKKSVG